MRALRELSENNNNFIIIVFIFHKKKIKEFQQQLLMQVKVKPLTNQKPKKKLLLNHWEIIFVGFGGWCYVR